MALLWICGVAFIGQTHRLRHEARNNLEEYGRLLREHVRNDRLAMLFPGSMEIGEKLVAKAVARVLWPSKRIAGFTAFPRWTKR